MPWTKRDVVLKAYAELGRAGYEFDITPDDLQHGLEILDLMALEWSVAGVRIGYSGGNGFGDINQETEVPGWAFSALYLNLAVRLAAGMGKVPMPTTMAAAKASYDGVVVQMVKPVTMQASGYMGAGARNRGRTSVPVVPIDELGFLDGN